MIARAELKNIFENINLEGVLRISWSQRVLARARENFFPNLNDNIIRVLWHKRWWRKLANYLLIEHQIGRKSIRVRGKPYWLTIDPTNFCQLRCPFCPTGSERKVRAKSILKLEDFEKVLDELGPTLLHIDFMNWGEPLLHPHVFDMVAYAKKFNIDTQLSTNLNEFNETMAEKMILSGLDAVSLSIDGLTQETYAKYRVRGDFNKVMDNLRILLRKKKELGRSNPYVIWQFLVFKHNENEVEAVRRLGKEVGVDVVGVTPAYLPFRPGIKDEWLPLKPEHRLYDPDTFPDRPPWEWDPAGQKTDASAQPINPVAAEKNMANENPENETPNVPNKAPGLLGFLKGKIKWIRKPGLGPNGLSPLIDVKVYKGNEKRLMCTWPWAGLTINPNGSVSPCCSVEEDIYDFGNIFQSGFRRAWNDGHYLRARRHIRDYVEHAVDVKTRSEHACERCFSVGHSNFIFQPWWRSRKYDWWWGIDGAVRPLEKGRD